MEWLYLASLAFSIFGLGVLDWRYRLAFWYAPRRAAATIATTMLVFIVWDILGIALGIFRHGESPYALPFVIAPEFPLEELFFLFLLSYCTLIIYRGVTQWRLATSS